MFQPTINLDSLRAVLPVELKCCFLSCRFCVNFAGRINSPLGYTVVMKLASPLFDQGYNFFLFFFFDNFYTSPAIINDLYQHNTPSCGTTTENRKDFPDCMKGGKVWGRKNEKGDIRWESNGSLLALQWKDNKIVTMLSSIDVANEYVTVNREIKISDK